MDKTDFFTFTVNEDKWHCYLVSDEDNVIVDEDSMAETDFSKKEIYVRSGDVTLEVLLHETWHIFFGYTCSATADLTHHQTEELSAELFAMRGQRILDCAKEVYDKLKQLKYQETSDERQEK